LIEDAYSFASSFTVKEVDHEMEETSSLMDIPEKKEEKKVSLIKYYDIDFATLHKFFG
jgi:hypothetical protein